MFAHLPDAALLRSVTPKDAANLLEQHEDVIKEQCTVEDGESLEDGKTLDDISVSEVVKFWKEGVISLTPGTKLGQLFELQDHPLFMQEQDQTWLFQITQEGETREEAAHSSPRPSPADAAKPG